MPYRSVLQLALRNKYGNKSLKNASYEQYKLVKAMEVAVSSKDVFEFERRGKRGVVTDYLDVYKAREKFNPMIMLMTKKILFLVWKE